MDDEEIEVRAKAFQILNNIDLEKANKSVIDGIPLNIGDKVYCVYQSSLSYGDDWYYLDNEITDFYEDGVRKRLNLLRPKSWNVYAEFAAKNDVRAFSLHPPRRNDCSLKELETALLQLEKFIKIPVYIEVMPTEDYWCSSMKTLVNHPLLIDVSHIFIWYVGDINLTQQTCLKLLNSYQVGEIHLSHNKGKADTHDLIPSDVWVYDLIQDWIQNYLVTFESLPVNFSEYERLDKRRYRKTVNSEQLTVNS